MTEPNSALSGESPAAPRQPAHEYVRNEGYIHLDNSDRQPRPATGPWVEGDVPDKVEDEDDDDVYNTDEEIIADDLAAANPTDYTKLYNRILKSRDPSIPEDLKPKTNPQVARKPKANTGASLDDELASLSHHAGSIKLNAYGGAGGIKDELRKKDKADRATRDQVMDKRTKVILLKLANRGLYYEFYDVPLSTGKEANVYHAVSYPPKAEHAVPGQAVAYPDAHLDKSRPRHLAIKIYKTRILDFKDRDRYVKGEWRFQGGYNKNSNLSKVKVWAEKEFRNLNRIHASGIPSPEPYLLKSHVLLMSFVGEGDTGEHAPKLREVDWSLPGYIAANETREEKEAEVYYTILSFMRVMFHECKLVHGDLSEYNILYFNHRPWIIDVSQSVEQSHPRSLELLRMDIQNINTYFSRQGVDTLPDRMVYEFVSTESLAKVGSNWNVPLPKAESESTSSDPSSSSPSEQAPPLPKATTDIHIPLLAAAVNARAEQRASGKLEEDNEVDNQVFRKQYIPQTLEQVYDFERDALKIEKGQGGELLYGHLLATTSGAEKGGMAESSTGGVGSSTAVEQGTKLSERGNDNNNNQLDHSEGEEESGDDEGEDDEEDSDEDSDEDREGSKEKEGWIDIEKGPPRGRKFQDKQEKKAHKEAVKKEKAEKRLEKMPKHQKKKLVRLGAKKKR